MGPDDATLQGDEPPLPEGHDPLIGQELGRCRIEALLGRGGMGSVYRAHHGSLAMDVAVKVLAQEHALRDEWRERFLREAQVAARLRHPNVVAVLDVEASPQRCYMVMELVEGQSLGELVAARGGLGWREAAAAVRQAAEALASAHELGLIHRDIKPDNLMMTGDVVKVADFGLARMEGKSDLTRSGSLSGTPAYMSPEQVEGLSELDGKCDVFSLGVTLFAAIRGGSPFSRESLFQTLSAVTHDALPELERAPAGVNKLLSAMCAKRPADRPTMLEVGARLDDLLAGRAGAAPAAALVPPSARRRKSSGRARRPSRPAARAAAGGGGLPVAALAGGGALLALLVLVAIVWGGFGRSEARAAASSSPAESSSVSASSSPSLPLVLISKLEIDARRGNFGDAIAELAAAEVSPAARRAALDAIARGARVWLDSVESQVLRAISDERLADARRLITSLPATLPGGLELPELNRKRAELAERVRLSEVSASSGSSAASSSAAGSSSDAEDLSGREWRQVNELKSSGARFTSLQAFPRFVAVGQNDGKVTGLDMSGAKIKIRNLAAATDQPILEVAGAPLGDFLVARSAKAVHLKFKAREWLTITPSSRPHSLAVFEGGTRVAVGTVDGQVLILTLDLASRTHRFDPKSDVIAVGKEPVQVSWLDREVFAAICGTWLLKWRVGERQGQYANLKTQALQLATAGDLCVVAVDTSIRCARFNAQGGLESWGIDLVSGPKLIAVSPTRLALWEKGKDRVMVADLVRRRSLGYIKVTDVRRMGWAGGLLAVQQGDQRVTFHSP